MQIPENIQFTREHEWVQTEEDTVLIGISDHAQSELGDIVYVELPAVGDAVSVEQVVGSIESVKSVSEIFSPVSGEIIEINAALADKPELINEEPYGMGWMFKIKLNAANPAEDFMSLAEYEEFIK